MARKPRRRSHYRSSQRPPSLETLEPRVVLAGDLIINEFLAQNDGSLADQDGDFPDWIELKNTGDEAVNTAGWTLGDSGNLWPLPDVTIEAGGFLLVFASSKNRVDPLGELHANFKLRRSGELLELTRPDGTMATRFDPYPDQEPDVSYGFSPGHDSALFFAQTTPGAENPHLPIVEITEFMASNQTTLADEDGDFADWIELYNAGDEDAYLAGWKLADSDWTWEFPEVTLPAGEYLVVFASENDRNDPDGELHTNFKLAANGDSLILERPDGTFASGFDWYPPQRVDVSYGHTVEFAEETFFENATPGGPNITGSPEVRFDQPAGFYHGPFAVGLTTEFAGAEIRFTTDGSLPTETNGLVYQEPLAITTTTVLRAAAFAPNVAPKPATRTYVFPADVVGQSGAGLPDTWGFASDYEMDPEVVAAGPWGVPVALQTLPTISIALEMDDLFSIADGIYAHPALMGDAWQREASFEWIDQYNEGSYSRLGTIQITGDGDARNPFLNPKHSFDFSFSHPVRAEEVPFQILDQSPSDQHSGFVLRASHEDSWLSVDGGQRNNAIFARDQLVRDLQGTLGQPFLDGTFVHVYLNGLYWGVYNVHEQPSALTAAEDADGVPENYDVVDGQGVIAGDQAAWDQMLQLANEDLTQQPAYEALQEYVDINNLADFIILKRFAELVDTDNSGWFAARDRTGSTGFQFYLMNSETGLDLGSTQPNQTPDNSTPEFLFNRLRLNAEFLRSFMDRVQLHTDPYVGALTIQPANQLLWYEYQLIDALPAESARWGDFRRDVNPIQTGPYVLHQPSQVFLQINRLRTSYVDQRRDALINELRSQGLFPVVDAPMIVGRFVTAGTPVVMEATSGVIHYTTDGSDPALPDGSVSPAATQYSSPILIQESTQFTARAKNGNQWSPLTHVITTVVPPPPLRVAEIMYHPLAPPDGSPYDDDDFEYVEIANVGSEAVDLTNIEISGGIDFVFADGNVTSVPAGKRVLVVKNEEAFATRYDTSDLLIAGEYVGNLNNGGDDFRLHESIGGQIEFVEYADYWYPITDGDGYALVARDLTAVMDYGYFENQDQWSPSNLIGGSPGIEEGTLLPGDIVINEILAASTALAGDWVEIANTTNEPVDIGGWYLSDDPAALKKFRIADGVTLPPGGFVVFTEAEHFGNVANPGALDLFGLRRDGETVFLASADSAGRLGGYRERVAYTSSATDVSLGRFVKADGTTDFVALTASTPGAENAAPIVGPIVISEIMFGPIDEAGEYVELHNVSDVEVPLYDVIAVQETWGLSDGIEFEFPSGVIIPAGGYLLVSSSDPELFRARRNLTPDVPIYGPYQGVLRNEGETVQLYRPQVVAGDAQGTVVVDHVRYDNHTPWPFLPVERGASLERRDVTAYGNDIGNWRPSLFGGTPGTTNEGVDDSPQSLPFEERFETGSLFDLPGWTFSTAGDGSWSRTAVNPHQGRFAILSQTHTEDCFNQRCDAVTNEAVLAIAVNDLANLTLDFAMRATNGGDVSVLVSDNRRAWHPAAENLYPNYHYDQYAVDVGSALTAANVEPQGVIYIKVSHSGWQSELNLDNVRVSRTDLFGPWIDRFDPTDLAAPGLDHIEIDFSEPVDENSFTVDDIRIISPVGERIFPAAVFSDDRINWRITFAPQTLIGTYLFEIGPEITDEHGNVMNRSRFTINERPLNTAPFAATVDVGPAAPRAFPAFEDFEAGAIAELSGWSFAADTGSRWTVDAADAGDGQFSLTGAIEGIDGEIYQGSQAATFVVDLPSVVEISDLELDFDVKRVNSYEFGNYGTVEIGQDGRAWHVIGAMHSPRNEYTHFAYPLGSAIAFREFEVDAPVQIRFTHTGDRETKMLFDNIRVSNLDVFGPHVIGHSPADLQGGSVDHVTLTFSEAIDQQSLGADDVLLYGALGNQVDVTAIESVNDTTFRVSFLPQSAAGNYRLFVGPDITDAAGNLLNQDRDPVSGELENDQYWGSFQIGPPTPQPFPYTQGFETDDPNTLAGWSFSVDGDPGTAWLLSGDAPVHGGQSALVTQTSGRTYSTHAASLALDLSDQADSEEIYLDFWLRRGALSNLTEGRLFVSGDGEHWSFLSGLSLSDEWFVSHAVDLGRILKEKGIAIDDDVHVQFQFLTAQGNGSAHVILDDVRVSNVDVVGPKVVSQSTLTDNEDGTSSFDVTFDRQVAPASFSAEDVEISLTDSKARVSTVDTTDNQTFTVTLPTLGMAGIYDVVIGPNITSLTGIPMNQNSDFINGDDFADAYRGRLTVVAKPQTLPLFEGFEVGSMTALGGWIFHTVNQAGNRQGGEWRVTSDFNPYEGSYHLQATQFADCWSQHDGILAIDLEENTGADDLVLDFYLQRTTTNAGKSQGGSRNMGQLLVSSDGTDFTQVGGPSTLLLEPDGVQRFGDLNDDGILDLVPTFQQYVHYQFDLDALFAAAGVAVEGTVYVNFHRLAFWNTDVTTFDNIHIYRAGTIDDTAPQVAHVDMENIAAEPHLLAAKQVTITFDEQVAGFDLGDLSLMHNGANLLPGVATLTTTDSRTWTLGYLDYVADMPGSYALALAAESLTDLYGNPLQTGFMHFWTDNRLEGDANLDGKVDAVDFGSWNDFKFTTDATWGRGDLNGDNVVDVSDFNRWLDNRWTARAAAGGGEPGRVPRAPLAHRAAAVVFAAQFDADIDPPTTKTASRDHQMGLAMRQEIGEMPLISDSQHAYRQAAREHYFARLGAAAASEALPEVDEIDEWARVSGLGRLTARRN